MARSLFVSVQFLCLTILACLVSSCVTPGTSGFQYREPNKAQTITNEVVVKFPFSDTWDLMIGHLAKSFFVINNVEKVSRIINVSFSTDKPEEYVDCGITERTFQYANESQTYTYPVASSSSFKTAGKWGPFENLPWVAYLTRKTSLEGRINVYVAPKDNDTIVTVNTRYILGSRMSGHADNMNAAGTVVQTIPIPERALTISFNTGQIGSADWGTPAQLQLVKCHSTGKLENEILEMARR